MGYGVKVEVWGEYALFSRPEMKVERVSYDVITPSAARGLLEAIYWKPALRWKIDRIHVLSPIHFTKIQSPEFGGKPVPDHVDMADMGKNPCDDTGETLQNNANPPRTSLVLKDVHYIIEAHFELTEKAGREDTADKHYCIASRRIRNGQYFHPPCFGCREFPANFRLVEEGETIPAIQEDRDLGYMLYDMDYSNPYCIRPLFFRAQMHRGIVHCDTCKLVR